MTTTHQFWWLTCICIQLVLLLSIVQCRRYDKCTTHGGRQGVCVVKRYCRDTSVGTLQYCDGGDTYCCPLPTTSRPSFSAPENPPPDSSRPREDPPISKSREEPPPRPREDPPSRPRAEPPSRHREEPPSRHREDPPSRPREEPPSRTREEIPSRSREDPPPRPREEPPSRSREEPPSRPREEPPSRSREEPPSRPREEPPSRSREDPPISRSREDSPSIYRPDEDSPSVSRPRDESPRIHRPREEQPRKELRHDVSDDQNRRHHSNPERTKDPPVLNGGRRTSYDDEPRNNFGEESEHRKRKDEDRPSYKPSTRWDEDERPDRAPLPKNKPVTTDSRADDTIMFPGSYETSIHQPKVPDCGVKPYDLFIAGGDESDEHEWPWMTAIFRRHQGSKPKTFLCGGSLINTRYVLTAAHCFVNNYVILPASSFVVRLGSHFLDSGEEYTVSYLAVHNNHSGSDFFNDIALARLASEVYITDKIAPVCLPVPHMLREDLVGRMATVAGWGDTAFRTSGTRILQHVVVPIVSSDDCFAAYSRVKGAAFLAKGSDHVVCAGLREGGKDACLGDSGGPLMLKTQGDRWVVIGIVSLGYKCAEPGYPGVYTRVTHYMSWIQSKIKSEW